MMAEREGFEPSIGVKAYTPLAGERLQPLGHLSEESHIILQINWMSILENSCFTKFYSTTSKSCVIVAVSPSIIDAEQYFSADNVIALSTFFSSKFCPLRIKLL